MNLYTSLTLRYLKQNKRRTLVTIIGIILATSLICGIGNIYTSIMDFQIRSVIESESGFYAKFMNVDKKKAEVIVKSAGISEYGYTKFLGNSILDKTQNSTLTINAYDKNTIDSYQLTFKDGRYPKSEDEIALTEKTLKQLNKKIGDTVTLDIGEIKYDDNENLIGLLNSKKNKFKIVGIIKNDTYNFAITGLDINSINKNDVLDVYISTKKPKDIYITALSIGKNIGLSSYDDKSNDDSYFYNEDTNLYYKNIDFNENLLRLLGASQHNNINITLFLVIALVASLVIICTIATIYNSFSIAISERKKQFGILNSIGATKSQIIKLVFLEGALVSIIAIPIGLLSGTIAIDIVFKIIKTFFQTSSFGELNLKIVFDPTVLILSTIIILITIFVSAVIPAINAAKISPLEAIRNSSNLRVGKIKSSKLVKMLFKTEGELAYKNLRRNKGKFRITLFSLIISIVIFISFNGFVDMFLEANEVNQGVITNDLILYENKTFTNKESLNLINSIKNIDGVKEIAKGDRIDLELNVNEKNIKSDLRESLKQNSSVYFSENNYRFLNCSLNFPGDFSISKIKLSEGKFDKKTAKDEKGVILVRYSYQREDAKKAKLSFTNYKVGDTLNATIVSYNSKTDQTFEENIKLKILAITDEIITGSSQYKINGFDLVAYDDLKSSIKSEYDQKGTYYVLTDKSEKVRNEVKKIAEDENLNVTDKIQESKDNEESMIIIKIFVYGFIVIISLVSVTNIINTISTNINLRKREFAVIKSIGVTPKNFNKMIYMESVLYGILSLLYGIPIGICMNVLMNKILQGVITVQSLIPYKAILICVVAIFIVVFISSYIPLKKITKENIIENIRQESI